MNAPQQFMDRARELDADIMALDRRFLLARANNAPAETLQRMRAQRNALVRQWSAAWQTKPVSGGLHVTTGESSGLPSHNGESEPTP